MAKSTYTIEPWAAAIGHLTISWNHCQSLVLQMLHNALRCEISEARAIFFALPSEQAQRDVTGAALEAALRSHPALRDKAATAIEGFGQLTAKRNDLVHAIWFFPDDDGTTELYPDVRKNIAGKDPAQEAWRLSGELGAMAEQLHLLCREVANALSHSSLGRAPARNA